MDNVLNLLVVIVIVCLVVALVSALASPRYTYAEAVWALVAVTAITRRLADTAYRPLGLRAPSWLVALNWRLYRHYVAVEPRPAPGAIEIALRDREGYRHPGSAA